MHTATPISTNEPSTAAAQECQRPLLPNYTMATDRRAKRHGCPVKIAIAEPNRKTGTTGTANRSAIDAQTTYRGSEKA
jgi:membrane-bound lytic murein transglycosylase